jgi:hypothetical protein
MKVFSSVQITVLTITNTGSQLIYGLYSAIEVVSFLVYEYNNTDLKNTLLKE